MEVVGILTVDDRLDCVAYRAHECVRCGIALEQSASAPEAEVFENESEAVGQFTAVVEELRCRGPQDRLVRARPHDVRIGHLLDIGEDSQQSGGVGVVPQLVG
ncbi:hypothetical protein A3K89_21085 [Rhodococcoides kyotonense]|uniref:Uncharacterized protein n=1 Tax=Rhodococcoides kyotonense TaxID=398843 RepID=A0A177YEN0_9NOCA|nr:hypothetical protein A3K89_21085 [Rhodococcus kyotonensis]